MSRASKASHEKRLSKGRRIRSQTSAALRALRNERTYVVDVLRTPSDAQGRCSVYDVLRNAPGIGAVTAKNLCIRFKLWPHDAIASIPTEQRENLIAALPGRAKLD